MRKTVFVLGWEPFNTGFLQRIENPERYDFRPLLGYDEAVRPPYDVPALLETAQRQIADAGRPPDAIVGYWDFPTSGLLAVLRATYGLPGPSLEAVLRCEHKAWSRRLQQEALPDLVPAFRVFDPFDPDSLAAIDLPYPYWIKPVKAHSSHLGFRIHGPGELRQAAALIRRGIDVFAPAVDEFLRRAEVPAEVAAIGGRHCIAEEIISRGRQCTLEGYTLDNAVKVYGIVDSVRGGRHRSSFTRYQYPSRLPRRAAERMIAATGRLVRHLDYRGGPFNVEFYWDERRDTIKLLEINARISKSHCPLFYLVDGASNQQVTVRTALGKAPDMPRRAGRYPLAAKFMLRRFADATVRQVPDEAAIARLHDLYPDAFVHVLVHEGQRLAHLPLQDSYSFELCELFLGAENQKALLGRYRACLARLPFIFEDTPEEVF